MKQGVRLGIDHGRARIGVARSDPAGMLAVPVETVPAGGDPIDRIIRIADEFRAVEIIVGLPLHLNGREGDSARAAREFAGRIAERWGGAVRLVDERLSTASSHRMLREVGRNQRDTRGVIDQAAAVTILQNALDAVRSVRSDVRSQPAGPSVERTEGEGP